MLRSKQKAAGHGYALLPIVGINTYLIRMERKKANTPARGKIEEVCPSSPAPKQNNIKSRKAMPEWRIAAHHARIAIRLIIRDRCCRQ